MTTPRLTLSNQQRRLLDAAHISAKLGQPHDWFTNYRGSLEAIGFPSPCLPADDFGEELWDEAAIDLWLDSRIDPRLSGTAATGARAIADTANWEQHLNDRARSLSL